MTIEQRLQAGAVVKHLFEKVDIEILERFAAINLLLQLQRTRIALLLHALDDHGQDAFVHRIEFVTIHVFLAFASGMQIQYRLAHGVPMKR